LAAAMRDVPMWNRGDAHDDLRTLRTNKNAVAITRDRRKVRIGKPASPRAGFPDALRVPPISRRRKLMNIPFLDLIAASGMAVASTGTKAAVRNVVLVHGGFVDGSGWSKVHKILKKDGYKVTVVQNPTTSLEEDVAVTRRAIEAQDGPVVLVGQSYGGAVVSEVGADPKVKSLAYIAAFAPDTGESVQSLISKPEPGAPKPPMLPPKDGYVFLDRTKFAEAFAADVPTAEAEFMADSQVPWGVEAIGAKVTRPAWKTKPSWYLVATDDRMIPPPAQRMMAKRAGATVTEVPGSHAIYVSKPEAVAKLIEQAAGSVH
jgi:pimeloyl-ACP methyl ester carboxylesterase